MNINQLIEKLQILKQNLERKGKTEVLLVEHAFVQGAIESHIRSIGDWDIMFEQNLQNRDLVYIEGKIEEGVIIGIIPKYT